MKIIKIGFLLCFLLMGTTQLSAQSTEKETKKSSKKKQATVKEEEEEKIEEIKEYREVNVESATVTEAPPQFFKPPARNYDTSSVPQDKLTDELDKLILEMKMVEIAIMTTRELISKSATSNQAAQMAQFYKEYSAALDDPETRSFYRNLYIRIYRRHFTLEEVKELSKFYQSRVGQKSLRVVNPIMQEAMDEGSKFGAYLAEKVLYEMNTGK
jgi:hypothetical protein